MYHNQQPTDGGSPSPIENHLTSAYSLAGLVSSAANSGVREINNGKNFFPDTTDSVYARTMLMDGSGEDNDYQLDDLIDEVGEAEDDRAAVGIDDENYSLNVEGTDLTSGYVGPGEEEYAALEPQNEIYMNSLLDTDIEIARPYDSKPKLDTAGTPFYQILYYGGQNTEEVSELEGGETEDEPIFTVSTAAVEDPELDPEPNCNQEGADLEARLGFKKDSVLLNITKMFHFRDVPEIRDFRYRRENYPFLFRKAA